MRKYKLFYNEKKSKIITVIWSRIGYIAYMHELNCIRVHLVCFIFGEKKLMRRHHLDW